MKRIVLLVVFLISAFVLLSYRIALVPPGINGDEAGIGYNAILISRNLTDENNNFLPLFIFAKGSDWKQPVSVYTTALLFRIFGPSYFLLRATSILFVLASLVILYFMSKEYGGVKFFVLASLILITTPIIMIQSHLALENIAPLPFIFFWLWMLPKRPALAGMSLGIALFSYLGMRLIVPMLVLTSLVYLRKNTKTIVQFILGVLPFFALLGLAYLRYPGAVVGNYQAPMPTINEFLFRYLSIFDLSFLFLKGDSTSYHSTGKAGMLLLATLPLFLIGIYRVLRDKKPLELLVLSSFFLSPILYGLVPDIYRASRLVALVPFFVVIATIGALSLSKRFLIVILILIAVNFVAFTQDYWFAYPNRVKEVFPIPIERTHEFLLKE